ncbi:hypothetical protein GLYMA_15G231351v4 [Glycine max]|nr:hypothetical protein GLYMA_15G231351v4 [Glycine max]
MAPGLPNTSKQLPRWLLSLLLQRGLLSHLMLSSK